MEISMRNSRDSTLCLIILLFLMPFCFPMTGFAEEPYVFERMWPNLQQPWYFLPRDVTVDSKGFIYIVDESVKKLNSDGQFITEWTSDIWWDPSGIAINMDGNVFVVDNRNSIIQIFSSEGKPLANWGEKGSGTGQFDGPKGIDIDGDGNVYVTDGNNHRVQKLDSNGRFVTQWGSYGSGDGNFDYPTGIAVDNNGYVYVIDCYNSRVQKFKLTGQFIRKRVGLRFGRRRIQVFWR